MRRPLRLLLKGTVWSGLNVGAGRIIPSILVIVLAWWITPAQLGAISFVLAAYTVLSLVADWSITYAVQKLIPENKSQAGEVAWTALALRMGLSVLLGAACWGLDAATNVFHGFGVYLAVMLVASGFGMISFIHNANCNFSTASLIGIAIPVGWFGTALLLVKAGMPVTGPLLALCVAYTAVGLSAILLDPKLRRHVGFVPGIAKEILRYGAWATLATVLIGVAGQVGVLVVAYMRGDEAAAVFKVAATFAALPAMFGTIVVMPLMPIAKRKLLDGHDISELARQVLDYLLLIGLPVCAAGFVLAPAAIHSFVAESYRDAVWPLRILLGANLLRMVATAFSGILLVGEGLRELAGIHASVAGVALVGSVFLIRFGGLRGVAIALLLAWVVGSLLLYRWLGERADMQLDWRRYMQYAASAALMAGLSYLAASLCGPPREKLAVGLLSALASYPLLLWVQGAPAVGQLAGAVWQLLIEGSGSGQE